MNTSWVMADSINDDIQALAQASRELVDTARHLEMEVVPKVLPELHRSIENHRSTLGRLQVQVELRAESFQREERKVRERLQKQLEKERYDAAVKVLKKHGKVPVDEKMFEELRGINKKKKRLEEECRLLNERLKTLATTTILTTSTPSP